ncbi:unnamed protein product [Ectocarpus sp. 6 AP-2014]
MPTVWSRVPPPPVQQLLGLWWERRQAVEGASKRRSATAAVVRRLSVMGPPLVHWSTSGALEPSTSLRISFGLRLHLSCSWHHWACARHAEAARR